MESSNMSCIIPGDLVFHILSWLPAKSLIKFRSVCKAWDTLTRDRFFIAYHTNIVCSSPATGNNSIMIVNQKDPPISKTKLGGETSVVKFPLFGKNVKYISMFGPCNGLVCIHFVLKNTKQARGDGLAIWNPATNEMKALPLSGLPFPSGFRPDRPNFGFGYDRVTDDYKVVRIIVGKLMDSADKTGFSVWGAGRYGDRDVFHFVQRAEVYSTNTNLWKLVKTNMTLKMIKHHSQCVYLNGYCYWVKGEARAMTLFDMTNDVFSQIKLPAEMRRAMAKRWDVKLMELNGSLCLLSQDHPKLTLWVDKTWIKQAVIELISEISHVLMIQKSGDMNLIVQTHGDMVSLYDPSTLSLKPMNSLTVNELFYCKETLVTFNKPRP